MEKVNNTLFESLIEGFKYLTDEDLYEFKNSKYRFRGITEGQTRVTYYFINIAEPTDIKSVICPQGSLIPLYDGFNEVQINSKLRKIEYQRHYYEKVTKQKRQLYREQNKNKLKRRGRPRKPKVEKALPEPIKCAYCGKEFIPIAKNQRFHSDECRKKYYSEKQSADLKVAHRIEKVCPICGKKFTGTPREKYCSKECFKVAQSKFRKERYLRDKILIEKTKTTVKKCNK